MSGPLPVERPATVELHRVRMPLVTALQSAHGSEAERSVVVVAATADDGLVGWGECDALERPTYTGEWQDGAFRVLEQYLAPAAVSGGDAGVRGHPMAAAAVHTATVDLALRRRGDSLASAMGATSSAVGSTAVVGIAGSIDDLLVAVAERVASGHPMVKLKLRPGWDVDPVTAVRSTWPDLALAADANGTFDVDAHATVLDRLDRAGLCYLEQPFAPGDLVEHATASRRWSTPVALDESIASRHDLRSAIALGFQGAVNLKPARLGGLDEARLCHDLIVDSGLVAWCGGMLELGIGRAAALAVAALPGCELPTDLGPSTNYVERDLVPDQMLTSTGQLSVPTGPGLGVDPDRDRLAEFTVERRVVRGR
ncbi:MAG: o-succinylbenzoate synthase [Acidimicrobiales bacterium]